MPSAVQPGLDARAETYAPTRRRDLLGDCCARAVTAWTLVIFTVWLGYERWGVTSGLLLGHKPGGLGSASLPLGGPIAFAVCLELIALTVGLALIGYRRLAGFSGLAWVAFFLVRYLTAMAAWPSWQSSQFELEYEIRLAAFLIVPVACYVVMIVAPGHRPRHPQRLIWLLGAWLLGGIVMPPQAPVELLAAAWYPNVLLLCIAAVGVYSLAANPSRSVALALALLALGLPSFTSRSLLQFPDLREYLHFALTTLVPLALTAGATARLIAKRRGLPS